MKRKELIEWIEDVFLDLFDKVSFADKNPADPFKSVMVTVTTRDQNRRELSGYEVWFSLKGLIKYDDKHQQFDRPSSPTSHPLPPGNYAFWTRNGSVDGPRRKLEDLGSDGQPERSIDPLLTP